MPTNRVQAALSSADQAAILKLVQDIQDKLPFLIGLTDDERKALPKLGDRGQPFAEKVLDLATRKRELLPPVFDLEAMRSDVELVKALEPVVHAFNELGELLNDTLDETNAEAVAAALQGYRFVKTSSQGELDDALAELAKTFSHRSRTSKPSAPAPGS
jgi:hypothetical protein